MTSDLINTRTDPERQLRVVIADDEPLALQRLHLLLGAEPGVEIAGEATDGEQAARQIEALAPDLAFLDISMPRLDGVALARTLLGSDATGIVFVTAYDEFAAQAFEVDAVDYILKPVSGERLRTALARARRRAALRLAGAAGNDPPVVAARPEPEGPGYVSSLWVQKRQGLAKIDVSSIEWIEAARDYAILHTDTRSYIMRATMDTLARTLDPEVMIRVSRSAFVRKEAVRAIERQGRSLILVLADQVAVRAGTTFIRKVEAQFGARPLSASRT